ncbi:MAG: hypothetical protein ABFE07_08380 [Armatimonadia bacterium]
MRIIAQPEGIDLSREGIRRCMGLLRASSLTDEENEERRRFLRYIAQPMAWIYWAFLRSGRTFGGRTGPQEVFARRCRSYAVNIPLDVWFDNMCAEFGLSTPPIETVEIINSLSHCSGEILRYFRSATVVVCGTAIQIASEWREESRRGASYSAGTGILDGSQPDLSLRD